MSALQFEGLFIPMCGIQYLSSRSYVNVPCALLYLIVYGPGVFQVRLGVLSLEKLEKLQVFCLCLCLL